MGALHKKSKIAIFWRRRQLKARGASPKWRIDFTWEPELAGESLETLRLSPVSQAANSAFPLSWG